MEGIEGVIPIVSDGVVVGERTSEDSVAFPTRLQTEPILLFTAPWAIEYEGFIEVIGPEVFIQTHRSGMARSGVVYVYAVGKFSLIIGDHSEGAIPWKVRVIDSQRWKK